MDNKLHPNFIKSSNLIFISFGVGLISLFLTRDQLITGEQKTVVALTMLFILGLGFLVRQGHGWVKYLLLVLTLLGLIGMLMIIPSLMQKPINGLISIIQTVLQVWAMILLFRIPSVTNEKINEQRTE